MKILSEKLCQPFDKHRNGLNLGEKHVFGLGPKKSKKQNKTILGYLDSCGNANDAHQTASSATEKVLLAMKPH